VECKVKYGIIFVTNAVKKLWYQWNLELVKGLVSNGKIRFEFKRSKFSKI